jgi:hypothetical protein
MSDFIDSSCAHSECGWPRIVGQQRGDASLRSAGAADLRLESVAPQDGWGGTPSVKQCTSLFVRYGTNFSKCDVMEKREGVEPLEDFGRRDSAVLRFCLQPREDA